jgi:hypothetical protein
VQVVGVESEEVKRCREPIDIPMSIGSLHEWHCYEVLVSLTTIPGF